jgi:hypothetical protein
MGELRELVEPLSAATRQKVIGENVRQAYGLEKHVGALLLVRIPAQWCLPLACPPGSIR